MMRWLLVGAVALLMGCASRAVRASAPELTAPPVVATTVVTRDGLAQGCPVGPREILTARHVVEDDGRIYELASWGQEGAGGIARVRAVDAARDLAVLEPETDVPTWYPVAEAAPDRGAPLWMVGYDHGRALAPRTVRVSVQRVFAGALVVTRGAEPGFSGSCVWDASGRAVGVLQWVLLRSDGRPGDGIASAMFGAWREVRAAAATPQPSSRCWCWRALWPDSRGRPAKTTRSGSTPGSSGRSRPATRRWSTTSCDCATARCC